MGYVGRGTNTQVLTDNTGGTLPNFQSGSGGAGTAKAWGNVTVAGGPILTLNSSFNVASIGLSGSDMVVTFTNPVATNNYAVVCGQSGSMSTAGVTSQGTNSFKIPIGAIGNTNPLCFAVFSN